MNELRPLLPVGEAPLALVAGRRRSLDVSVRPLCRGLVLAAALSLPAFGPHAADLFPVRSHPEAVRAVAAPSHPPTDGAAARTALLRGGAR